MKKIILIIIVCFLFAVNLFSQTPQYYNSNSGTSSNSFPFNVTGGKAVNYLFLAGEFNQPAPVPAGQRITKVYFRMSSATSRTFSNLHILMTQDVITNLTNGQFYPGPYDTVYFRAFASLVASAGGWMSIALDHPFVYDPAKSLVMFVGQCGAVGTGGTVYNSALTGIRRIWSVSGCPFTPYSGGDAYIIDFGFDIEPVAPQYYNYSSGGHNEFPFNQASGKMVQWLVGVGEFNQPSPAPVGSITGFYFRMGDLDPLGPVTYTDFNIRLGQTSDTLLHDSHFYSGSMDTVYHRDSLTLQQPINSWLYFRLDRPFAYKPTQSLIIEVGQCGASGLYTGYCLSQTYITNSYRRAWSVEGCPFTFLDIDPTVVNCGFDFEFPIGVSSNENKLPSVYRLEQNYPNPFNPVTNISYSIPKAGNVKLAVYDVLGREIASLVNEYKTAGNYSVNFDAENLASGIYVYRIESGDFTAAKKMMLVK